MAHHLRRLDTRKRRRHLFIHSDESIWDGLKPSVETVRHANTIHGSFSVSVKGYSTEVRHNASSTDVERALMSLPSVTAV